MLADWLLVNGRVYTMDTGWPVASELAVAGKHILAVGDDLRGLLAPGGQVLDLGGRCVLPGLIDSHIHFTGYALGIGTLNLSEAASLDEMQALVAVMRKLLHAIHGMFIHDKEFCGEKFYALCA